MFGIEIDSCSLLEAVARVCNFLKTSKFHHLAILTAANIYDTAKDKEFKEVYKDADLVLADSISVFWASKLLGQPLKERVTGASLLGSLLEVAAKEKYKLFVLKGSPGSSDLGLERALLNKFSGINIVGTYYAQYDFDIDKDASENEKILDSIRHCEVDILIVSLGSPKGGKWIRRNQVYLKNIAVGVEIGEGIDFVTGRVKRAPVWMQKIGLEWLFRLCREPGRLWRRNFINNSYFLWILIKEFFKVRVLRR